MYRPITKASIAHRHACMGYELFLGTPDSYVVDVTLEPLEPYAPVLDPLPTLDKSAAQSLLDSLWAAGLRPTRDVSVAGEVEFLRRQLDRATLFAFGGDGE